MQALKDNRRRCDGCGILAGDEHLRRRTLRLEMATRFRPVHIGVLLLTPAPPVSIQQFPYFLSASDEAFRQARIAFQSTLLAAAGIFAAEASAPDDSLPRLQRAGIFMASAVECPLEELGRALTPSNLAEAYGAEIVIRITRSYKPRNVLLMGTLLEALPPVLLAAGLSPLILLDEGKPFEFPEAFESRAFGALRSAFAQSAAAGVARP
jgi:hypothetical protein